MGLEEHGAGELGLDAEDSGVEALEVADLEDAVVFLGEGDEGVGFSEGGGDGLFDEAVDAGRKELRGDVVVMDGRNGYRGGVEAEAGAEGFFRSGEDGDGVLGGYGLCALGMGFNCGGESDAARSELAVDAEVVGAEGSGAGDGDAERIHLGFGSLAVDGVEAAAVEIEELADLLVGLGSSGATESS
jgi:hypothetical protein